MTRCFAHTRHLPPHLLRASPRPRPKWQREKCAHRHRETVELVGGGFQEVCCQCGAARRVRP